MTDPRYAGPDVSDPAVDKPPIAPPTDTSVANVGSGVDTGTTGNEGAAATRDPQATTELPRTGWDTPSEPQSGAPSQSGSPSDSQSQSSPTPPDQPDAQPGSRPAGPSWSTDETHDFPAYRPQSYPTYPPTLSQTSELPAVGAGGPPPTSAAAYGPTFTPSPAGPPPTSASAYGQPSGQAVRARRRDGAGIAGALSVVGICASAVGLFALPMERYPQAQNIYLGTFRDLATRKIASSSGNHHSVSLAGEHLATLWWRFALLPALGVLGLLVVLLICVPVLRRVAGAFLFLGALAVLAGFAVAVPKTNQYRATLQFGRFTRFAWSDLTLGFWIGVGGIAVLGLAGLVAASQSTRR